MNEQREERYWSRFAHSYEADGEYVVGKPILEAVEKRLLEEDNLGDVVEFGCGTGYYTKVIARNARHVVATDLSEQMLEVARRELRGLANVVIDKADCTRSDLAEESFDSVVMINLIHVIEDPSRCLCESYRVLREGGRLIAVDLTGYGMSLLHKMRLGIRYLRKWGMPPRHGRDELSPEELASLVEGAGFRVERADLLQAGANALYLRGRKG
jgi:ubiquinone/menaquinone biosynthesis C-methylase UbiE